MNIKRNILFSLEKRKKDDKPVVENVPIRMRVIYNNQRIDEVTPKYALLGTHAGRRTFICNALSLGIPAQVVMKWTGHSDYKAMSRLNSYLPPMFRCFYITGKWDISLYITKRG